jgi:hypothetical protein
MTGHRFRGTQGYKERGHTSDRWLELVRAIILPRERPAGRPRDSLTHPGYEVAGGTGAGLSWGHIWKLNFTWYARIRKLSFQM